MAEKENNVGMATSGRGRLAVLVIAGLGLVLTACGGDDDDAAPAAEAEAEADDGGDANTDNTENADNNDDGDNGDAADAGDDDETIKVDDINDLPDECVDLMGEFLQKIEPFVEDVDWENADLAAMEGISEQLDAEVSGMDAEMTNAGCDEYELDDTASMDALIDLAKDKAPGTVAYFEFIKSMSESFSAADPGSGGDDGDTGGAVDLGDTGDVPQDCDGAIDYIRDLMDKYDSMMDMNVSDLSTIGTATSVITTTCSVNEMNDFLSDPEVTEWMSAS